MEQKKKKLFKAFCVANGLTAKKIEEECGISKNTIFAYFRGARTPSKKNMKILAEKYGEMGLDVYKCFVD